MAFLFVLCNDAVLDLLGMLLIIETEQDEAKASATLRQLLSHDDRIFNLAELLEVRVQMVLTGREG